MNKNLVYLVVPKKYDELIVPPFTAMCLSAQLKKQGYAVKVFHIHEYEIDNCVAEIVKEQPLFVGFSVFTGIYNLYAAEMSKKLKAQSDGKITVVWGGVHPSIIPTQCLQEKYIDFVVIREGEITVVELANALRDGLPVNKILGIGFKKGSEVIVNPHREFIKDLDNYRMDFDCVDMNNYVVKSVIVENGKDVEYRSIGYYGSRGCPFDCKFCYNLQYNDRKWRAFSAQTVLGDIQFLHDKFGVNDVMFWDDLFFTNKFRALDILKALKAMGIRGTGSDIRFDSFNEAYLKELKAVGASYFLIGAESGSDRLLKLIKKGFDSNFILERVKLLDKYDATAQYSFILGLPTETKEEFHQTVDFMYQIHKIHRKSSFTVGIYMPYPGAELFDLAVKLGYQPPKTTEEWSTLDRWRNTVSLPWVNQRVCLNVRTLFAMLNWDLGVFNKWVCYRIEKKWLKSDLDLKFLIFYYNVFIKHNEKYLRETIGKIHSNIKGYFSRLFAAQTNVS